MQFSINTLIKILKWKLLAYFMRPLNSIRWIAQWLILITIHILKSFSALWNSCSFSQGLCVSVPWNVHEVRPWEHGWPEYKGADHKKMWLFRSNWFYTVNVASQRIEEKQRDSVQNSLETHLQPNHTSRVPVWKPKLCHWTGVSAMSISPLKSRLPTGKDAHSYKAPFCCRSHFT